MSGVVARGLKRAEPDVDGDAGSTKPRVALAGDFRVGILDRGNHARNAGRDDSLSTGRRLADMRTRLQCHIKCGATCRLPGAQKRLGLGVGTASGLRPATADNDAVLDHDCADGGIGPGTPLPAPPERQRQLHEP